MERKGEFGAAVDTRRRYLVFSRLKTRFDIWRETTCRCAADEACALQLSGFGFAFMSRACYPSVTSEPERQRKPRIACMDPLEASDRAPLTPDRMRGARQVTFLVVVYELQTAQRPEELGNEN